MAETKEVSRIVDDKISAFHSAQNKSTELIEQAVANLEKAGDRLSEIHKELQTAIRDKIDISRSKMSEMRLELRTLVQEVESFSQLSAV